MKGQMIDKRNYVYKNKSRQFFCPLCSTPRVMRVKSRLTKFNHVQLGLATGFATLVLFPWLEWKTLFSYFFFWVAFEMGTRILFKQDMPCPHCGFDATWYKKDVKMARKKVQDFWQAKAQNS